VLHDTLLRRVLVGLKERLLAPELVAEFVRSYIAEISAANRANGARQAGLAQEQAKLGRQIRNLLELMKDGRGSVAMIGELRELERQHASVVADKDAATPEPKFSLHPNLPELYRRRVAALEEALIDPATAAPAAEALRSLIDAILIIPGERRGEVTIQMRGDLAAFVHLEETSPVPAHSKTARLLAANGGSGRVLGSLVAGAGFEP
jgi:hypothetical protein